MGVLMGILLEIGRSAHATTRAFGAHVIGLQWPKKEPVIKL
jgi:hypothetical protein